MENEFRYISKTERSKTGQKVYLCPLYERFILDCCRQPGHILIPASTICLACRLSFNTWSIYQFYLLWYKPLIFLQQRADKSWRICSRWCLKTLWHNEQFLLLSQCFQLIKNCTFIYRDFHIFWQIFQSCRIVICGRGLTC